MVKRYVFWRQPDGKAYRKPDGKCSPNRLLAKIGLAADVNQDGSISWKTMEIHEDLSVLRSTAIVISPDGEELNEADAWSIFHSAIMAGIRAAGSNKPILQADVISIADRKAATFFRRPKRSYFLLTSLSIKSSPVRNVRANGCEVSFLVHRPKNFVLPKSLEQYQDSHEFKKHIRESAYACVRVKTEGRTVSEATNHALETIDLIRSLWTLCATRGVWAMNFGTGGRPIGPIRTGPIHTLHKLDGPAAKDIYWYEPHHGRDVNLFTPKKGWDTFEEYRRDAMRRLKSLRYGQDLIDLLIRYVTALDKRDLDVAFLQLWSLLEKITDTGNAKYDETIKRTVWPFRDRGVEKEKLGHLRLRRNQFVHSANSDQHREQDAYLAKSYVDVHLSLLLANRLKVRSLEEYGKFLSQPINVELLQEQHRNLGRAIRLRKEMTK